MHSKNVPVDVSNSEIIFDLVNRLAVAFVVKHNYKNGK